MARHRWLGAGVITAGLSINLLSGAAVALAEQDPATDSGGQAAAGEAPGHTRSADPTGGTPSGAESADPQSPGAESGAASESAADPDPGKSDPADTIDQESPAEEADTDATTDENIAPSLDEHPAVHDGHAVRETGDPTATPGTAAPGTVAQSAEPAKAEPSESEAPDLPSTSVRPADETVAARKDVAVLNVSESSTDAASGDGAPAAPTATAPLSAAGAEPAKAATTNMTILDVLLSLFWGMMTSVVQSAAGTPSVPSGSTVSLRSSSLQLTDSLAVPADWYFPEPTEPGQAPQHVIFLSHGMFTVGAMYSYTAAQLAENTGSIVVVPTMSWNPYAPEGLWIGGPEMQPVIADLFDGDRAALNASALAAGYAKLYGLDPALAELPREFVLSGHSAGAALLLGAITHLDNDTLDDLTGLLLFDAVTSGSTAADGLARLADYEEATGRYIPLQEISAPPNDWNRPSNIHQALAAARPNHFNGVIISGGAHTDSVQSGSPAVQSMISWLVGNISQRAILALQQFADDSVNGWYAGHSDGAYVEDEGSTIVISTPGGPITATVLGVLPAAVTPNRVDDDAIAV